MNPREREEGDSCNSLAEVKCFCSLMYATCLNEVHCFKDGHVLDLLSNHLTIEVTWHLGGVGLKEKEIVTVRGLLVRHSNFNNTSCIDKHSGFINTTKDGYT